MTKGRMTTFFISFLCCFLAMPVSAKNVEGNIYRICKNDIFSDSMQANCKKIVTEMKTDGCFVAEDLGVWLKNQNVYDISVVEENEYYKKIFYERNSEELGDEFYDSDDASYIDFDNLVYKGDIISYVDCLIETVISVESDGSFYTQIEPAPSLPLADTDKVLN